MSTPAATRVYRSELRAEQAQRTRSRILESAAAAFSANGYQATTIAAIASAAGVSVETVKSAGSKSDLLIRAFELLFAGVEGAEGLTESEEVRRVLDLPAEQMIDAIVRLVAEANARGCRLWTVLLGASLSDPLVDGALQRMLANRRRDYVELASLLVDRKIAHPALDPEQAAAEMSFLMSPEGYEQLVHQTGWDDTAYRDWLTAAVHRVVSDTAGSA